MNRSALWTATILLVASSPLRGQEMGVADPAVVATVLEHASRISEDRPLHVDTLRSDVTTRILRIGAGQAGATIGSPEDVLESENGKWVRWAAGTPGGAVVEIHEVEPQPGDAVRLHYTIYVFKEDVGRTEGYVIELDLERTQGKWGIENVRVIAET